MRTHKRTRISRRRDLQNRNIKRHERPSRTKRSPLTCESPSAACRPVSCKIRQRSPSLVCGDTGMGPAQGTPLCSNRRGGCRTDVWSGDPVSHDGDDSFVRVRSEIPGSNADDDPRVPGRSASSSGAELQKWKKQSDFYDATMPRTMMMQSETMQTLTRRRCKHRDAANPLDDVKKHSNREKYEARNEANPHDRRPSLSADGRGDSPTPASHRHRAAKTEPACAKSPPHKHI